MKITLTRVLETSKILATDIGQKIPDFFNYMAEFVEQVVRALRNGLTFQDNFDCLVKTVSLQHDVPQVVSADRKVNGIIPLRVMSQSLKLDGFGWYYDQQNRLTVNATFDPTPTSTIDVMILILF